MTLTGWGEFVNAHSAYNDLAYWQKLRRDVERIADHDGNWQGLLQERIRGLTEFLERREANGSPENWQRVGTHGRSSSPQIRGGRRVSAVCDACHGVRRVVIDYTGDPLGPACNLVRPIYGPCPVCTEDADRAVDEVLEGVNDWPTP